MKSRWLRGNQVRLLENGEDYFPAVFEAIRNASHEVLLETFIIFEDKVGLELHAALLQAASNGAQVDVLFDGFGTADLSVGYLDALKNAGIRVRAFDPSMRLFNTRFNWMRRMHRKLVVVDGKTAFVGGINYSADHLADYGPQAKQDYAVELQGPIVEDIRAFLRSVITEGKTWKHRRAVRPQDAAQPAIASAGTAAAMLVVRDNVQNRAEIERYYRIAVRASRKRVIIANAYFFPGFRLLRELKRAARRGVNVQLILQGEPDVPLARTAAQMLYTYLHRGGVKIYEYCERPIHAKVAVVDDDWATVGSSNLDPLSLSLNLEANVILRDATFAAHLRDRLEHLIATSSKEITDEPHPRWGWWVELRTFAVFHFLRNFSVWANWLPHRAQRLAPPVGLPHPVPQPQPLVAASAQPKVEKESAKVCHAR